MTNGWSPEALAAFVRIHYTVEIDQWEVFMSSMVPTIESRKTPIQTINEIVEKNYEIIRIYNPQVYCIFADEIPPRINLLSFLEFEKVIINKDPDSISWWPDVFKQKSECLDWLSEEMNKLIQLSN